MVIFKSSINLEEKALTLKVYGDGLFIRKCSDSTRDNTFKLKEGRDLD